jgi:hypothetical protein
MMSSVSGRGQGGDDTMEAWEQLAGAAEQLQAAVRAALGEPQAALGNWDATPLHGGVNTLTEGGGLFALSGTARVGSLERPWSLVLKRCLPAPGRDDPAGIAYWKREPLLYGSGFLDDLPGLRAPRCYGCDQQPDGSIWLWLERVQEDGERRWPLGRWALAARHLGKFNGAYLAGRPLPPALWLGGGRLRSWLARHGPLVERIAAAADIAELRRFWPRPVVEGILRLWQERETFLAALEQLPQTFAHGDAIRRNLLARRSADGSEETVAIDWELAGYYAPGEEVGQTLSVAAAFGDLEPADLPTLDEALFAGYLAGLGDAGWQGDPRPVRFAYAAHAALRNAFNAVGAGVPGAAQRAAAQQNYGRSWEELAERRAAIRPFLLARAEEARRLLAAL